MKSKIFKLLIVLLIIVMACSFKVNADEINVDYWNPSANTDSNERITEIAGSVLGVFQVCGTFVSIVGIIFIGIKYMVGSIEKKAEYRKTMIPYVIGCIMIFCVTNIAAIIYDMTISITSGG